MLGQLEETSLDDFIYSLKHNGSEHLVENLEKLINTLSTTAIKRLGETLLIYVQRRRQSSISTQTNQLTSF